MPVGNIPASVAGNARIDEAKITGMTPPVFTFSGMCVLDPPYIRRPTSRFAYCTVTRRWPRSMKMIAATTTTIITSSSSRRMSPICPVRSWSNVVSTARGRPHDDAREDDERHPVADAALGDLLAQPHDEARARRQREHGHQAEAPADVIDEREAAGDVGLALEEDRDAECLHDGEQDRAVARVLRDLPAPSSPSFESRSRYGHTTVSSCRMIDALM